ncbi:hypothetical protein ACTFIZ_006870 [Dictyostelium cf. discoideum]
MLQMIPKNIKNKTSFANLLNQLMLINFIEISLQHNGLKDKKCEEKWTIKEYRKISLEKTPSNFLKSNDYHVGSHIFNVKIYPNGEEKKEGNLGVYIVRNKNPRILLKYDISFSLIPPDGSKAKKVSELCHIDFEKSKKNSWGAGKFAVSTNVLNDFLNDKGELEISFSIHIKDEKFVTL